MSDAARRAGSIVTEYIDSIVDTAERKADEIRQTADREADEIRQTADREAELARQEALNSAQRVFERINALEQPIGELVQTLRMEMERVGRELESVVDAEAIGIAAESEEVRDQGSTMPDPPPSGTKGPVREPSPPGREPESEVTPRSEQGLQFAEEPALEDPAPIAAEEPALEDPAPIAAEEPVLEGPAAADEGPLLEDSPSAVDDEAPVEDPAPMAAEAGPSAFQEITAEPVPAEPVEGEPFRAAPPERDAAWAPSSEAKRENEPALAEEKERVMFTPEPAPAEEKPRSKIRSVFSRGSKGVFITSQGHCSVCQRMFMAGTEENLRLSGWRVSDDVGLCPECQAGGWQLPDGARLPFRRGGA